MKEIDNSRYRRIILIVDDDPENVRILTNLVNEQAYTPIVANRGDSALKAVEKAKPALILLNTRLPDLDGFEVCRQLKDSADTRNIPVIFISTLNDEESVLQGFEVGGVDYIVKPFRTREVWARLQIHLALHELHQKLEVQVTEHTKTAKLWADEHYLLRALIDAVPDYIFVKDREGRFLLSNVAHAAAVGLVPDDLIGKVAADIFPGTVAPQFYQDDEEVIRTGQPLINLERVTTSSSNNLKWVLTTKIPLTGQSGEIIGLAGVSRDITERRLVQEALQERERSYKRLYQRTAQQANFTESLLHNMPVGVLLMSIDDKIVETNPALSEMLGYPEDELKTRDFHILNLTNDHQRVTAFFQTIAEQGIIGGYETEFLRKNGSPVPVRIRACRLENVDGEIIGILSTIEDVTQYRIAEEARQMAERLRVELEKEKELRDLKSHFVSTVSHEFRTPLATIRAATEALQNYHDRMDANQKENRFHKIYRQIQLLTKLVEDISIMDQIESAEIDFRPEQLDFPALVQGVIDGLKKTGISQRIQFVCEQTDPVVITGDRILLRQFVSNLIFNAANYSSTEDTIRIEINHVPDQHVVLKVIDTGIGIPEDEQKHIFSNFYRAANTTGIPGSGLGLAVAKHAVEQHGGIITFESSVNVGTTFTVTLPCNLSI